MSRPEPYTVARRTWKLCMERTCSVRDLNLGPSCYQAGKIYFIDPRWKICALSRGCTALGDPSLEVEPGYWSEPLAVEFTCCACFLVKHIKSTQKDPHDPITFSLWESYKSTNHSAIVPARVLVTDLLGSIQRSENCNKGWPALMFNLAQQW